MGIHRNYKFHLNVSNKIVNSIQLSTQLISIWDNANTKTPLWHQEPNLDVTMTKEYIWRVYRFNSLMHQWTGSSLLLVILCIIQGVWKLRWSRNFLIEWMNESKKHFGFQPLHWSRKFFSDALDCHLTKEISPILGRQIITLDMLWPANFTNLFHFYSNSVEVNILP